MEKICVFGASGSIGSAFVELLSKRPKVGKIYAISRKGTPFASPKVEGLSCGYFEEEEIEATARKIFSEDLPDTVIFARGILHDEDTKPEKSLRELSPEKFQRLFAVNTIAPALAMKHFLPRMDRKSRSIFAAVSARVGSISDNFMGGWYSYRASKAALNMLVKNAAIERGRSQKNLIVVGLHPGTVDSNLSKPFQKGVPEGKLFSPEYSASKMLAVLDSLSPESTGGFFDYEGLEIRP